MDRRTTGIIATVVAALLCGCPGLLAVCFGAIFALAGAVPGAQIDMGGSNDPAQAIGFGLAALCLGGLLVLVPISVGFFTLRKPAQSPVSGNDPIPPAI